MGDVRIGLIKLAPENILTIWRPSLPLFPEQRVPHCSSLNSFQWVLKVSSCSSTWFNPCRGRWQVSTYSWHINALDFQFQSNFSMGKLFGLPLTLHFLHSIPSSACTSTYTSTSLPQLVWVNLDYFPVSDFSCPRFSHLSLFLGSTRRAEEVPPSFLCPRIAIFPVLYMSSFPSHPRREHTFKIIINTI